MERPGSSERRITAECYRTATSWWMIASALNPRVKADPRLRRTLQRAYSGTLDPAADDQTSRNARDSEFELWLAAWFAMGEKPVDLKEPDLEVPIWFEKRGVAAKRVTSLRQMRSRIDWWWLGVNWLDRSRGRNGRTNVQVFQPTGRAGYAWMVFGGRARLEAAAALGAEINASSRGEAGRERASWADCRSFGAGDDPGQPIARQNQAARSPAGWQANPGQIRVFRSAGALRIYHYANPSDPLDCPRGGADPARRPADAGSVRRRDGVVRDKHP